MTGAISLPVAHPLAVLKEGRATEEQIEGVRNLGEHLVERRDVAALEVGL